jgi:monofunctional biosynthetic peptidoglycan transglycosylase
MMEQRKAEAAKARRRYKPQQVWVPLERISRRLVEAVVASEDAKFFAHRGFDWEALEAAARHDLAKGRFARGASTISQQLAKNLWLGTEKSLLRKAKEAVLTAKLERALDKRRILAIYLNVAEWGDGTFGVEAGARRHLGVGAGSLSTAQAVLLASMLPAPRRVDLSRPSGWLRGRAGHLLARLRDERAISPEEYREAKVELDRLLRGPAPPGEVEEVGRSGLAPPLRWRRRRPRPDRRRRSRRRSRGGRARRRSR